MNRRTDKREDYNNVRCNNNMTSCVYDFEKDKSVWLKAILPFLIVVHHCACMGVPYLGPMKLAGVTVCTWFFLVSGYGLMASYMAKGDAYLTGFLQKRLSKIAIPYTIALVVYLLWIKFIQHGNLYDYLVFQNFDHWLPYSWFIFVISGGYILFFLAFKNLPAHRAVFVFLGVSIAYIMILSFLDVPRYWYGGSLGIAIGIMWRKYEITIRHLLQSNIFSITLFGLAVILWIIFSKYIQFKELHPLFTSTMLMVVVHRVRFPKVGKGIRLLSSISFELYLFQALAMRVVFDVLSLTPSWHAMILLLLVDVLVSAIFHFCLIQPIIIKLSK